MRFSSLSLQKSAAHALLPCILKMVRPVLCFVVSILVRFRVGKLFGLQVVSKEDFHISSRSPSLASSCATLSDNSHTEGCFAGRIRHWRPPSPLSEGAAPKDRFRFNQELCSRAAPKLGTYSLSSLPLGFFGALQKYAILSLILKRLEAPIHTCVYSHFN